MNIGEDKGVRNHFPHNRCQLTDSLRSKPNQSGRESFLIEYPPLIAWRIFRLQVELLL